MFIHRFNKTYFLKYFVFAVLKIVISHISVFLTYFIILKYLSSSLLIFAQINSPLLILAQKLVVQAFVSYVFGKHHRKVYSLREISFTQSTSMTNRTKLRKLSHD